VIKIDKDHYKTTKYFAIYGLAYLVVVVFLSVSYKKGMMVCTQTDS